MHALNNAELAFVSGGDGGDVEQCMEDIKDGARDGATAGALVGAAVAGAFGALVFGAIGALVGGALVADNDADCQTDS